MPPTLQTLRSLTRLTSVLMATQRTRVSLCAAALPSLRLTTRTLASRFGIFQIPWILNSTQPARRLTSPKIRPVSIWTATTSLPQTAAMQKSASFMTNHPRVHNKGFTLLETLIYIALLGMLLTGVLLTAYPLFTGAERITKNVTAEGEAAFILRKISWALSSAASVSTPSAGSSGATLTVGQVGGGSITI